MKLRVPEYDLLNRFVGKWNTEGILSSSDSAPEIKVQGTDTYEWLPGAYFLLHKVNVTIGNDKNETLEIIGFDGDQNVFTLQHYDNKGNSGFMTGTSQDDHWTFMGEYLRFTGGFKNQDQEFSGVWEQYLKERWMHLMVIKLTRMK